MKKTLFTLCIVILLISCNNKTTKPIFYAEVSITLTTEPEKSVLGSTVILQNFHIPTRTYSKTSENSILIFSDVEYGTYFILATHSAQDLFAYHILTVAEDEILTDMQMVTLQNEFAGGIVFYDKGHYSDGWRFIEVAPVSTEVIARFGAYGHNIIGTSPDIGTGRANTPLIVAKNIQASETNSAAQVCYNLTFNGFSDWFLPSLDELKIMHDNLKVRQVGNFRNDFYWSSSQNNHFISWEIYTWNIDFLDGSTWSTNRRNECRVRAIRYF
jgi:hypothetical protein